MLNGVTLSFFHNPVTWKFMLQFLLNIQTKSLWLFNIHTILLRNPGFLPESNKICTIVVLFFYNTYKYKYFAWKLCCLGVWLKAAHFDQFKHLSQGNISLPWNKWWCGVSDHSDLLS